MTVLRRERCCHFAPRPPNALYLVNRDDSPAGRGLEFTDSRSPQLFSKTPGATEITAAAGRGGDGCRHGLFSRQSLPQGQGLPNTIFLPFREFDLADDCVSHVARLNKK
jgi:hypothetical protein